MRYDVEEHLAHQAEFKRRIKAEKKLVEAAPDLLEACKAMAEILLAIESSRALTVNERDRFIIAEQAIAKAEGK